MAQPDLAVTKVKKANSKYYHVTIKNLGNKKATPTKLGVYYNSKRITTAQTPSIAPKASKTIKVKIPSKYQSKKYKYYLKTFKANYNNKLKEIKTSNNKKMRY